MLKHNQNDETEAAKAASPEQVKQVTIGGKVRNIIVPSDEEDEAITAAAMSDPDALPLTDEQLAQLAPARPRGRPAKANPKVPVNLRLDAEIIDAFKATGDGWQTRINAALAEFLRDHPELRNA